MPPSIELAKVAEAIRIRPMRETDFAYIIKTWLNTYKYSGPAVQMMANQEYYDSYAPVVERLIRSSDVYVAADRKDEDVIVGFLAIEKQADRDLLHFVSVKRAWQGHGVGRYLFTAAEPREETYFTHWTAPTQSLKNKYPHFKYNPFLVFKE